jgi:hypothetical protein
MTVVGPVNPRKNGPEFVGPRTGRGRPLRACLAYLSHQTLLASGARPGPVRPARPPRRRQVRVHYEVQVKRSKGDAEMNRTREFLLPGRSGVRRDPPPSATAVLSCVFNRLGSCEQSGGGSRGREQMYSRAHRRVTLPGRSLSKRGCGGARVPRRSYRRRGLRLPALTGAGPGSCRSSDRLQ